MIEALVQGLGVILQPHYLSFLFGGVILGVMFGAMPAIGALTGVAIVLPFVFDLDLHTAVPLLLGLAAVTSTADTIPAVFFGIPGSAGAQASILDGYPMAQKGEAGRALGAAFTASAIGGLFGVAFLTVSIPVLRSIVLAFGAPEFFMLCMMGVVLIGVLSSGAPIKGIIVGGLGLLIGCIGMSPVTSELRWSFGQIYLWDGIHVIPVALGIFAIVEVVDLLVKGTTIADVPAEGVKGRGVGFRDTLKNWWLVIRCSALGAFVGFLPGLGATFSQWLVYGHAVQSSKNRENFGKGDVRGVIAPDAATNATMAGAVVPTIAFGIPGNATLALLLSAFLVAGVVPGPEMLTTNLDLTVIMIWSIAIANILAAGICFCLVNQLARISLVPIHRLASIVLVFVLIGSIQVTHSWGDVVVLISFSILGWFMKRFGWPRPPLLIGLILSRLSEKYLWISIGAYGASWLYRPLTIVIFVLVVAVVVLFVRIRPGRHGEGGAK